MEIVDSGDVVDTGFQSLLEFEDAKRWLCIPPSGFIWEILQYIPLLHGSLPLKTNVARWVYWRLQDAIQLVIGHYKYIASLSWLSPKAEKVWNVSRLQGGGKYYNVVIISMSHFVQRYLYGES